MVIYRLFYDPHDITLDLLQFLVDKSSRFTILLTKKSEKTLKVDSQIATAQPVHSSAGESLVAPSSLPWKEILAIWSPYLLSGLRMYSPGFLVQPQPGEMLKDFLKPVP